MRTHFPQTGWAWCHLGGLCPGAAISLGVGVGGVPAPKTRLPLVGQGGSGRKAVQGNAPSWTGRTGLGWQAPPMEKRQGAQPGFPSQNLWHLGGGEYHPRGGTPTALLEGDWAEILMASMLLPQSGTHFTSQFPHLQSGYNTIPTGFLWTWHR